MTEYTNDQIDAIQGKSFRLGNFSGQERALRDILRYVQEEMAKHLTLTPEGWHIPEDAHKTVLTDVSKRVKQELITVQNEMKKQQKAR